MFSEGDQLKVKLTDLKFPKEITWGSFYYLGAGGVSNREKGLLCQLNGSGGAPGTCSFGRIGAVCGECPAGTFASSLGPCWRCREHTAALWLTLGPSRIALN